MNNENAVAELRMQTSARRELQMTECYPPLSYLKENAESQGPVQLELAAASGVQSDVISIISISFLGQILLYWL